MALKHQDLISKLTLEEKVALLSGKDFWQTMDLPSIDLPSMFFSDGPTGLRKQASQADNLGLNPSKVTLHAPAIENFQTEGNWRPGDKITVPKGQGLLIIAE